VAIAAAERKPSRSQREESTCGKGVDLSVIWYSYPFGGLGKVFLMHVRPHRTNAAGVTAEKHDSATGQSERAT
jgi:hypothetical protein